MTESNGTCQQPRGLWVDHHINVGTYDVDFAGHVNNCYYLRYLEDMRNKLFDKYFPLKNFVDAGKSPVIAATNIEYKRPVKLFDQPYGVMWIAKMGNASLTMQAEIYVGDRLTTKASHVGVFIDLSTGKPIRLPSICTELFKTKDDLVPVRR